MVAIGSLTGKSFGLTPQQYSAVAYLLLAVQNSVEICETWTLYRRPGIDVLMCGKQTAYTVRVEPQCLRSSLFRIPLKSRLLGLGAELLVHEWEGSDITGEIGYKILAAEGESWGRPPDWWRFSPSRPTAPWPPSQPPPTPGTFRSKLLARGTP